MSNTAPPEQIISEKGLEGWKVLSHAPNTTLLLSAYDFVWKPKVVLTAHCPSGKCNPVVQKQCTCGIYAAKTLAHLFEINYAQSILERGKFQCIAKLRLWGRVELHTLGYRAQYAMIEELHYHCTEETETDLDRAAQLESLYEVPVTITVVSSYSKSEAFAEGTQVALAALPKAPRPLTLEECLELYALGSELTQNEQSAVRFRLKQLAYRKKKSLQKLQARIHFLNQEAYSMINELQTISGALGEQGK